MEHKKPLSAPSIVGLAGTSTKCVCFVYSFTVCAVPAVLLLTVSAAWWFSFIPSEPALLVPDTTPGVGLSGLGAQTVNRSEVDSGWAEHQGVLPILLRVFFPL